MNEDPMGDENQMPPEDEFETEDDRFTSVMSTLPAQDAPGDGHGKTLKIKRGPGRPRKVETMPHRSDLQYHAAMAVERQKYIESDPIVKVVEGHGESVDILFEIKAAVAREAASLSFESLETQKRGRETSNISGRRLDALKKIAEIELKLRELDTDRINLASEKFQKIFAFWVESMREVAQEVLPPEHLDLFFNRFATAMEGWEERAAEASK